MEVCIDETNKSFLKTGSELDVEALSFEDLKNQFYINAVKLINLKNLKKFDNEFKELCKENNQILEQIHIINHPG